MDNAVLNAGQVRKIVQRTEDVRIAMYRLRCWAESGKWNWFVWAPCVKMMCPVTGKTGAGAFETNRSIWKKAGTPFTRVMRLNGNAAAVRIAKLTLEGYVMVDDFALIVERANAQGEAGD